ncbi:phosphatase PAP2 family protein [Kitasatospora terrestris]|uniref:Inositolphosphotransferase Aur1/Ipt1 domain-containing protein n=1 Tax=Kitasatospora terrestris TaxID=258051 RepID=A0ABP9EID9_9ACTN
MRDHLSAATPEATGGVAHGPRAPRAPYPGRAVGGADGPGPAAGVGQRAGPAVGGADGPGPVAGGGQRGGSTARGVPYPGRAARAVPRPAAVAAGLAALLAVAALRGPPAAAAGGVAALALALAALLPARPVPRGGAVAAGAALGGAVALQPGLLLLALPLWRCRGRTAALTALAVPAAVLAADPAGAIGRWSPGGEAGLGDQSLLGVGHRLGVHGLPLLLGWSAVAAVAVLLALRRSARLAADGQRLLALGVLGCAATALAPTARPADLGWLLLAGSGRLGRRPEDRTLWPLTAAVLVLLPSSVLDPGIEPFTGVLLRNAPALALLAVACALRFRIRRDPCWEVRRAAPPPRPSGRRGVPLLPAALRPLSRPNLLLELLLIQVCYAGYTWVRNAAPARASEAVAHALEVARVERLLGLDIERTVNTWALRATWLLKAAHGYYTLLHFAVPLTVLAWLYVRHPARYRPARTVLFAATGLALVGFWGYPLAPPRLTPGLGLRDTPYGTPDSAPLGPLTVLTNQYAAMPSLHIAWAAWCALAVVTTARGPLLRALAVGYPLVTLFVVVATANHWVLDAVGGAAVLTAGVAVQCLLTGRAPPPGWQN